MKQSDNKDSNSFDNLMVKEKITVDYNSGHSNSGNYNSGHSNSGSYNSGHSNSKHYNSGHYNSGDYNSGDSNSGDSNSGDSNSGNYNSGSCNSGHYNSGYRNSGYRNSGHYNSGNYNSGWFNTNEPKMRLFNKECDFTYSEAINNGILPFFKVKLTKWISYDKMTEEEKNSIPYAKTNYGYVKTFSYKEAWAIAWQNAQQKEKDKLFALPGFDPAIFEEITGIKVETNSLKNKILDKISQLEKELSQLKDELSE